MHILVVASGYPTPSDPLGGIFEKDQALALRQAGHTVTYAAVDLRSARHRRPFGLHRIADGGLEVYRYSVPVSPLKFAFEPVGRHGFRAILRRVCAEIGTPDVVHAHFLGVATIVAPVCREKGLPLVITEHFSAANSDHPESSVLRSMRETYPKADALLAVSAALRDNIYRSTGVRARVVPNIADLSCFHAPERVSREGGSFTFVTAGNLIPGKNMAGLIRAFAALNGEPRLVIFGGGEERNALVSLCAELGVAERVSFRGVCPRGELAETYAAADCFVLASRGETFGVAYIEAMAAGLPVIATRCGGPEDFVTEKNGILVPVDDTDALVDAMEHMMRCRAEYDGAAIAAEVKERFSPEKIAAQLTAVYEEVVPC